MRVRRRLEVEPGATNAPKRRNATGRNSGHKCDHIACCGGTHAAPRRKRSHHAWLLASYQPEFRRVPNTKPEAILHVLIPGLCCGNGVYLLLDRDGRDLVRGWDRRQGSVPQYLPQLNSTGSIVLGGIRCSCPLQRRIPILMTGVLLPPSLGCSWRAPCEGGRRTLVALARVPATREGVAHAA